MLLLTAAVAALVWANSPWPDSYQDFWHTRLTIGPGSWAVREDLQHWVNDALMVAFTVSLFITSLAFTWEELQTQAKIGILASSLIAAIVGVALLLRQSVPAEDEGVATSETASV